MEEVIKLDASKVEDNMKQAVKDELCQLGLPEDQEDKVVDEILKDEDLTKTILFGGEKKQESLHLVKSALSESTSESEFVDKLKLEGFKESEAKILYRIYNA